MKIVYSGENVPIAYKKSIFLAGPTPRSPKVKSWRPNALKILRKLKYNGVVFLPEFHNGKMPKGWTYDTQCDWEHKCLNMADIILFWVPRKLRTMPALTTNIEFGLYANSGKIVLGAPKNAHKMSYFKFMASKYRIPYYSALKETLEKTLEILGDGALRKSGERDVPLHLWQSHSFQKWYRAQKNAGNTLKALKVLSIFHKVGPQKNIPWGFAIRPSIWIKKERRLKYNDSVVFRPDISSVALFKKEKDLLKSKIVLVKEFRNSVSTEDGFVHELPSGSSHDPLEPPEAVAQKELEEETGFSIDPKRLRVLGSRQLAATFSAHKAHVYYTEITEDELKWFEKRAGKLKINDEHPTGERLYIEIKTVKEILSNNLIDWPNLGAILNAILIN